MSISEFSRKDTWGFSKLKEVPEITLRVLPLTPNKNPTVSTSFQAALQATNFMIQTQSDPVTFLAEMVEI